MKVKKMTIKRHLAALCVLCLHGLLPVHGVIAQETVQDIAKIREIAEQYALQQADLVQINTSKVTAQANSIDPRLRLAACNTELEAFSMSQGGNMGRTTVGVRCTGSSPWTLYVPVQVDALVEVLTTNTHFQRGETPGENALEFREMSLSDIPNGYLTDPAQLHNSELVRSIQPGDILTSRLFRARELIKRGQEVVIHAPSPGIDVKMNGVALESGVSGQLISVQNTNSGRTIYAVVQKDSSVVVKM